MRGTEDKNILESFARDFCHIVKNHTIYIIVSGFVAIATGRTRATEDIDMIIPRISSADFTKLHDDLVSSGFEAIQSTTAATLYNDYLSDNLSVRYVRNGIPLPEMEIKFTKDVLDNLQLQARCKIPLTGLDIWFSPVEWNIAFKEELLCSDKDVEDARHLRRVFAQDIKEQDINTIKLLIKKYRN